MYQTIKIIKFKIPNSLRNNELYYTSKKFKKFNFSEIQLFHNNQFLNDNDEKIDYIKDGDIIKIIEQLHGVDFSYYNKYLSKHKDEPKVQIIFDLQNGFKKVINCTMNTSIKELIKIFYCEMNIPENIRENYFCFVSNGKKLNIHDKNTLNESHFKYYVNLINVVELSQIVSLIPKGKILEVLFKIDCINYDIKEYFGTLDKISELCEFISRKINAVVTEVRNIIKITINGEEIKKK